ncbi:MAG: glycosyltransferase family 2 protein [Flavobacteriaceae bacterium]
MYNNLYDILNNYLNLVFLVFTLTLLLSFLVMALIFTRVSFHHNKVSQIGSISKVMNSNMAPSISIIAPAYNEEATIIENIKSLLSLRYDNYEVIVVNDGSRDGTLDKIMTSFELVKEEGIPAQFPGKRIRGIYKSEDKQLDRLVVIDKVNGGKSDALNAGINYSRNRFVGCIDVDCLLNPDALSHVVRAFYQEPKKKVVAVGSVIRVANSCKISEGVVEQVRLPKNWLAKYQLLEYTRSFLLGRMAWGGIDGLLIISGAFGFFEREVLVEVGGYDTGTVGEDMEVIFKIRRHMTEKKIPYTLSYLPEPLCYTEVPEDAKILINQRDRWSRGNIETLKKHKVMFFNPRYGRLGMLSYPYWFFYEWLAPLLEFFGLFTILAFWYAGLINWQFFVALTLMVYMFAVMFSIYAISWDLYTYRQYTSKRDFFSLVTCALTEPFLFHPLVVYSAVRGNFKKIFKQKSGWGTITRKGFSNS